MGEIVKTVKKLIVSLSIILGVVVLTGCSWTRSTAKDAVKMFLDQYKNLSASVLTDLEDVIKTEDFTDDEANKYRDILKKQYSDLKYEIVNETYDGDTAQVETKITVYDLYKVQNDAAVYLNENQSEFVDDNGVYDEHLFLAYKLDKMQKMTDTVEYTIVFNVVKDKDDKWQVQEITDDDLEKIHGIYNYDLD